MKFVNKIDKTQKAIDLITIVIFFATLFINVPTGCLDSVIFEALLRKHQVNGLILGSKYQPYNDYLFFPRTCRTKNVLISTSKIFIDFLKKSRCDPKQFF